MLTTETAYSRGKFTSSLARQPQRSETIVCATMHSRLIREDEVVPVTRDRLIVLYWERRCCIHEKNPIKSPCVVPRGLVDLSAQLD